MPYKHSGGEHTDSIARRRRAQEGTFYKKSPLDSLKNFYTAHAKLSANAPKAPRQPASPAAGGAGADQWSPLQKDTLSIPLSDSIVLLFLLREHPVSRNHSVFRKAKNCEAPWGEYFLPPASNTTAGI